MRPLLFALSVLALGCTGSVRATERLELARLFPQEAEVAVDRKGWSRLDLPPEVLAQCRADLSDLRLFDRAGQELPFVIERTPASQTVEFQRKPVERLQGHLAG